MNEIFDTGGEICLKSGSVPGVKFFDQSGELLCNLTIVLASQVGDIFLFCGFAYQMYF